MSLLIAFAVLSIAVSFLCSILEAALLSITPSYVAQLKADKPDLHVRIQKLKDKIDQPLAAILTLNTIAHTVGAAGVGAQVTVVFGDGYLAIASVIMTLLILLLSEIPPKILGARYWRTVTPFLPGILNVLILILKPLIRISDLMMKAMGGRGEVHDLRQEIKALTLLGRDLNDLNDDEQRVIANILDLRDVTVRDILTPRTVCVSILPELTVQAFSEQVRAHQFSRYPVIDEQENPLGLLFRRDILDADPRQSVAELMKPVAIVSDKLDAERLMSQFLQERQHLFLVYDEYGSWLGLVTFEDVMETLLGKPIVDETDAIPDMKVYAQHRWKNRLKKLSD